MAPIRLTDEQLDAIFRAARPLRVEDRDAFLQEVARALQGLSRSRRRRRVPRDRRGAAATPRSAADGITSRQFAAF
jgi:hypothetical protein